MKIIVSHDIDHISWTEHFLRDLFIPKWLIKNSVWLLSGRVSCRLFSRRVLGIARERLHNVPEVAGFDRTHGVPSTFFVGVANGFSMSYPLAAAHDMTAFVLEQGFDVGVHGIAYRDEADIRQEYERFREFMPNGVGFGVRNHYLRCNYDTLALQSRAGYLFDSTEYGLRAPYARHEIWEFPVCLMDSYLIADHDRNDFTLLQRRTVDIIHEAERMGLPYFTIIYHDVYYSGLFPYHRAWYEWLVNLLKERFEFSSFRSAIESMRKVDSGGS